MEALRLRSKQQELKVNNKYHRLKTIKSEINISKLKAIHHSYYKIMMVKFFVL